MADQPSDEKPTFDPFKPAEPRLPGVPEKKAPKPAAKPSATDPAPAPAQAATPAWMEKLPPQLRALPPAALYGGTGGILLLLVIVLWFAFRPSDTVTPSPAPSATTAPATPPAASPGVASGQPSEPPPEVLTLPAAVATTQEMAKPWSFKKFMVRQAGTRTPAMLLRIPVASAASANGYWAFMLQSPFGRCELELITDLQKLQSDYGYRAQYPMVVDPCSQALFHPLRMGSIGASTYVRGELVQGSALRPPIAIDVRVERGQVIAVRTE